MRFWRLPPPRSDLRPGRSCLSDFTTSAAPSRAPENAHRTIEEASGELGEELTAERTPGALSSFAVLVGQPQAVQQRVALSVTPTLKLSKET